MTKIGIMGAMGRMGRMLIEAVLDAEDARLMAGVIEPSSFVGVDAGELVGRGACNVALSDSLDAFDGCDVVIDFSLPNVTADLARYCLARKIALVVGTTGLTDEGNGALDALSGRCAVVVAGNYSSGVNVSLNLIETVARVLGDKADIEIIETHHKHKQDAPSGTALMMAHAAAVGRGLDGDAFCYGRCGQDPRRADTIGIHAVRGGEIIGEHVVRFFLDNETIEIHHSAHNRALFADGAVRAAMFAAQAKAARYDMQDVLGLKSAAS